MNKLLQTFRLPFSTKRLPLINNLTSNSHIDSHSHTGSSKILELTCFFGLLAVSTQTLALNPTQIENAKIGDPGWYEFPLQVNQHDLEGYADKDSVNSGDTIKFFVNANPAVNQSYTLKIYRLGWYNGIGGRSVSGPVTIPTSATTAQVIPTPDPTTGLIEANWKNPYSVTTTGWTSGVYIVTLFGNTQRTGSYIPFVVRDRNRSSDYLFQASTTTWQAYNGWGGKSLYAYNSTGAVPSRKVSFNRPYDTSAGSGSLFNWEINMLFYMERKGYDVTYQSDTDTHIGDGGLLNHKAVLSVGHDEYWTNAMRTNFETARSHGISLGFFAANAAYWQIRLENSLITTPVQNVANRTIVGYKDYAATEDPLRTTNKSLVTGKWRDPLWANKPENSLIGIMYGLYPVNTDTISTKDDPYMVSGATSHWVYTATDLLAGATFPGLVGYEADRIFDNGKTPAGLQVVAASPVPTTSLDDGKNDPLSANFNPAAPKSHMSVYTANCTVAPCKNAIATIFATGSMQWVWGLDSYAKAVNLENVEAEQITDNVMARMISAPLPSEAFVAATTAAVQTSASAIAAAPSVSDSFASIDPSFATPSSKVDVVSFRNQMKQIRSAALSARDNPFGSGMKRGDRLMKLLSKERQDALRMQSETHSGE
jgi:hypothetical protein